MGSRIIYFCDICLKEFESKSELYKFKDMKLCKPHYMMKEFEDKNTVFFSGSNFRIFEVEDKYDKNKKFYIYPNYSDRDFLNNFSYDKLFHILRIIKIKYESGMDDYSDKYLLISHNLGKENYSKYILLYRYEDKKDTSYYYKFLNLTDFHNTVTDILLKDKNSNINLLDELIKQRMVEELKK